jgi:phospholipid/cholesterol/gamma-HCH transport system permease protein
MLDEAVEISQSSSIKNFSHRIGTQTLAFLRFAGGITLLSLQVWRDLWSHPFYFRLTLEQMHVVGVRSFLLVSITALATGSVMALQFGLGLERFGGTLYVPSIVSLAILREMGPVFTSLLVAGRIGSGIASEVASMTVTQQVDAIRALGSNPIKRIVIPRILACTVMLPLLTLFAGFIGLFGAMMVCQLELNIGTDLFIAKVLETVKFHDFWTGMLKTAVFAYFIGITACWKGLNTTGGTQGVGNATTWVVVTSSIFIMVSNVLLTKFFFLTVYPG